MNSAPPSPRLAWLILLLLVLFIPGCSEPEACSEVKRRVCDICGDNAPLCERIRDKTDTQERCTAMLEIMGKTFKELEARPEEERTQKLDEMCKSAPKEQ